MSSVPQNSGGSNLPPIVIPAGSPLVPDWAREAVTRLNMLVGATTAPNPSAGFGAGAFAFAAQNAVLLLPAGGLTQVLVLPKVTAGGDAGALTIQNGFVVAYLAPS